MENGIEKEDLGVGSFLLGSCCPQALSRDRVRKFVYTHTFNYVYLFTYIENHVFSLISPILIQQYRVHYNFLPFPICNSLLQ